MRDFYEMYMSELPCDECNGARLKKEILSIKVGGININEMTDLSVKSLQEFLRKLEFNWHLMFLLVNIENLYYNIL